MAGKEQAQAQEQPPGLAGRVMGWIQDNHKQQPKLISQVENMIREAVKDIRQTMNDVYFGRGEHAPEMGTPGNPTPQNVTDALGKESGDGAPANDNRSDYERALAESAQQQTQERRQGRSR